MHGPRWERSGESRGVGWEPMTVGVTTLKASRSCVRMLTDLYGAHQRRGLSARSVYQNHACLTSMFTQACRWGWRDSNRRSGPSRRRSRTWSPSCGALERSRADLNLETAALALIAVADHCCVPSTADDARIGLESRRGPDLVHRWAT